MAFSGLTEKIMWFLPFINMVYYKNLEKALATHSSVLAWRIPGTEEPDGLPSMGSHSQTRLK